MELAMNTRGKYDKQFKIDAVNLLNSSDKTASEVARDFGIRPDLIARLKKENAELTMERDIDLSSQIIH